MTSLVHSPQFQEDWGAHSQVAMSKVEKSSYYFFKSIPPERIGLNGEYDHCGLAKRVDQAFRKKFQASSLERLRVTQRGRVVVLTGQVPSQQMLDQLIATALSILGANHVETYGVTVNDRSSTEQPAI